jgi:hypothetical protein
MAAASQYRLEFEGEETLTMIFEVCLMIPLFPVMVIEYCLAEAETVEIVTCMGTVVPRVRETVEGAIITAPKGSDSTVRLTSPENPFREVTVTVVTWRVPGSAATIMDDGVIAKSAALLTFTDKGSCCRRIPFVAVRTTLYMPGVEELTVNVVFAEAPATSSTVLGSRDRRRSRFDVVGLIVTDPQNPPRLLRVIEKLPIDPGAISRDDESTEMSKLGMSKVMIIARVTPLEEASTLTG